ncbi:MAG: type IV pilus twitching motility protein PilT [Chloroherpetonaceae bacterium]|nr:type IV pilus twitching motility protein PilT [Chthonomonadaceae bacterium]MDW8208755.1 type IV pilus twitching motility protein PilT [Chloroherpetonaceae bacterium]
MSLELDDMILWAAEQKASDLFVKSNAKPSMRQHGKIAPTPFPELSAEEVHRLCYSKMTPRQQAVFEQHHEMDLAFSVGEELRIRMNVYRQRGGTATVCRLIPTKIRSLDELGIPPKVKEFTQHRNGLVLVTGPTGSGKTTTLASMIDLINQTRRVNIVTIEDPIEFVHKDKMAIVSQREVGIDTESFQMALRHVLRQAPDIILIGEMRDIETMNVALQAAETGHLVFATVHTASAAETLDRISNMFAPHERPMLWLRLSVSLRGVLSQKLLPRADGTGRVAAVEVMDVTPTIVKMLEEGRSDDIYSAIRQAGNEAYWGMQTMNQCLLRYVKAGIITEQEALANAGQYTELRQMIRMAANQGQIPPQPQPAQQPQQPQPVG